MVGIGGWGVGDGGRLHEMVERCANLVLGMAEIRKIVHLVWELQGTVMVAVCLLEYT